MVIKHISDTHCIHEFLNVQGVDVLIHSGDETSSRSMIHNEIEFNTFLEWFSSLEVKNKLFIPGNHSSFIYHNEKLAKKKLEEAGVTWLHKTRVEIEDIVFYGDGITPSFNDWFYNVKRSKTEKHWKMIPDDVNVLVTHGPPKGILDLSKNFDGKLEQCGDKSLRRRIEELENLKLVCFGHIHSSSDTTNHGVRVLDNVVYSNGALVKDGNFGLGWIHNGNLIEI